MERLEQVVAIIVAAGLAMVSYQLFAPARKNLPRPASQPDQGNVIRQQEGKTSHGLPIACLSFNSKAGYRDRVSNDT